MIFDGNIPHPALPRCFQLCRGAFAVNLSPTGQELTFFHEDPSKLVSTNLASNQLSPLLLIVSNNARHQNRSHKKHVAAKQDKCLCVNTLQSADPKRPPGNDLPQATLKWCPYRNNPFTFEDRSR